MAEQCMSTTMAGQCMSNELLQRLRDYLEISTGGVIYVCYEWLPVGSCLLMGEVPFSFHVGIPEVIHFGIKRFLRFKSLVFITHHKSSMDLTFQFS